MNFNFRIWIDSLIWFSFFFLICFVWLFVFWEFDLVLFLVICSSTMFIALFVLFVLVWCFYLFIVIISFVWFGFDLVLFYKFLVRNVNSIINISINGISSMYCMYLLIHHVYCTDIFSFFFFFLSGLCFGVCLFVFPGGGNLVHFFCLIWVLFWCFVCLFVSFLGVGVTWCIFFVWFVLVFCLFVC